MQLALKDKLQDKSYGGYSGKRLLYTICFFLFCLMNQRILTCSPLDGGREVFRNLTGVVMAVVIMSHYKPEDFRCRKLPYLLWSIIGIACAVLYYIFGESLLYFKNARLAGAVDIFLYGYIFIHVYISVFVERDVPRLHKKFFAVWLIMMALMIASRSNYIWPFCYLVMFGCFYLTNYTKEEQEDLFQGALDGIILSLFLFQAWCCVFRPYDAIRYIGIYSNSNHNALYYLFVLAAVFGKLVALEKKGSSKWLKLFYWLGAGTAYALIFMTIGRTAWIVAFLMGICFLWALNKIQQKKNFIKHGLALMLTAGLMFPLVFGLVRYLPPVFHHPVWFFGEWSEQKVHSWDEWDSEKFVEMDELLPEAIGRASESIQSLLVHSPLLITVKATEAEKTAEEAYEDMLEQGYALDSGHEYDSLTVRGAIYRYYMEHLNLFGHPYEEQGFQISPTYWIGHAHNIFLQFGTDFGIIALVLFLILTAGSAINFWLAFVRGHSERGFANFLFFMNTLLFGMLEYSWEVGGLGMMMLFIAWKDAFVEST